MEIGKIELSDVIMRDNQQNILFQSFLLKCKHQKKNDRIINFYQKKCGTGVLFSNKSYWRTKKSLLLFDLLMIYSYFWPIL